MKLHEYLKIRCKSSNALTKPEADLLYISYPLPEGWVKRYGNVEIDDELFDRLTSARKNQKEAQSKRRKKRQDFKIKQQEIGLDTASITDITKLVKTIVANGCSDEERLVNHLTKPITPRRKRGKPCCHTG
jgi:hypothetical protein